VTWRLEAVDDVVTAEDRAWQDQADRLDRDALPALRAVAGRWTATIGALTGLLGLVTLVGGPAAVDQLIDGWRVATGVLVLGAVLAASGATWLAADAQGGARRTLTTYHRLREGYRAETGRVQRRLWQSKLTTAVAVAALIVAAAFTWFAPRQPDKVLVVQRGGQVQCFPLKDGMSLSVVLDAQATVTVAEKCPTG
jgi:lysylphosphatidylglycerol synthetase-like protein (DUF2156 family)